MTSKDTPQHWSRYGFIRPHALTRNYRRYKYLPPDPAIEVDGPCLNKYLDSLEGLSGQ
jgi:hypothetical protein